MGNTCCSSIRFKTVSTKEQSLHSELTSITKKQTPPKRNLKKRKDNFIHEQKAYKTCLVPESDNSEKNNPKESSFENELEFTFENYNHIITNNKILFKKIFESYKSETLSEIKEKIQGFFFGESVEGIGNSSKKAFLISNKAIYLLDHEKLYQVRRRLDIQNIIILILSIDIKNIIIHTVSSDLLGDLWINSEIIQEFYYCIQVNYHNITKRYIPTISVENKLLDKYLNNLPFSIIKSVIEKKFCKISNVVILKGKIGENILCFKKIQGIFEKNLENCIICITNFSIFLLNSNFKYLRKLDLSEISSLITSKNYENTIFVKKNGENEFFIIDPNLIGTLSRSYKELFNSKLKISIMESIDVYEFINKPIIRIQ